MRFRRRPFAAGLAVAILRFAGLASDDVTAGTLPKDACTLLKPAEIQAALNANSDIGGGVPDNSALPLAAGCKYTWGPRTNEWGQTDLSVLVIDALKVWPAGLSSDDIKQRMLAEARSSGPDATEVPGIGDGAVFTTDPKSHNAKAKAYFVKAKGVLLEMTFHGGNPLSQKDKLIALLKAAAARL
jgi:hypothetical protein